MSNCQSKASVGASRDLIKVTSFLSAIGLEWQWKQGAAGFVPGVDILDGRLLVNPLAHPSSLLHEAGHLACLPGEFRKQAQRNISRVQRLMLNSIDFSDPDGELPRAALQCSDPEATAWAWAAGVHIGLAPKDIIQDHEYQHSGAWIRLQLQHRQYAGLNGLAHAGFCAVRPGAYAAARGLEAFPKLSRWLQKDFSSAPTPG